VAVQAHAAGMMDERFLNPQADPGSRLL